MIRLTLTSTLLLSMIISCNEAPPKFDGFKGAESDADGLPDSSDSTEDELDADGNVIPGTGTPGTTNNGNGNGNSNTGGGTTAPGGGTTDGPYAFKGFPAGQGMNMPWVEFQAEDGMTNAKILGPSRKKWDAAFIEAEAIGRKAVRLEKTGDYVSWKLTKPANSIVVRLAIPDSATGGGIDSTINIYVNNQKVKSLPVTSRYSWSYRGETIGDPTVDKPAEEPHTFFDESSTLLAEIPAGAEVKIQKDGDNSAEYYIIDLADFELVGPALAKPADYVDITTLGLSANSTEDQGPKLFQIFENNKSAKKNLWFPPGLYMLKSFYGSEAADKANLNGAIAYENNGFKVAGAGIWHTKLQGKKTMFFCAGATTSCEMRDMAIFGESKARAEEAEGVQKVIAGPWGKGSVLENLWIEHVVGAMWIGNDPGFQDAPTSNLTIKNCRIRNIYADGINFDNGTNNSTASHCHFRNLGDDAAVVWSIKFSDWYKNKSKVMKFDPKVIPHANVPQGVGHSNVFHNLTVQMPWRANCFANYGGYNNLFKDSTCEDVLTYPGILIDNEFSPYPFGSGNPEAASLPNKGLTTFKNITVLRGGGPMFYEKTTKPWLHGALKFYMREGSISDILVEDVDIIEPTYAGIEFRGYAYKFLRDNEKQFYDANPELKTILVNAENAKLTNITLRNIRVVNAGTYGISIEDDGGKGQVNFENVMVTGSKDGALNKSNAPDSFFNKKANNTGW